ncbi:sulfide/dihydroorotate dehydrogenase-like FAD/NAD-binding protein [Bacteroidota bacterium]
MFEIIERKMIVPNLHSLTVKAPDIAEEIQPGQFVIVIPTENHERIPLSIADWDIEQGTLTMIFMEVGSATGKLAALNPGENLSSIVGPLGRPTVIQKFGKVVCIGGCYGIGSIYPVVRAMHEAGNEVITIIEGRSNNLLYWENKLKKCSTKFISLTRDGILGVKGHIENSVDYLESKGIVPDRVIANGCTTMVYKATKAYKQFGVPIIVSLNTIMIDGTGMCGVCRVTVDGEMKFACVDGPDFDGRLVDWEELSQRRKQYINEEAFLVHNSGCGGF